MKILVIGGTGTVGSEVVRELLHRKMDVSVLTRTADKAQGLAAGARAVVGDLLDPGAMRSAFKGVEGVFLLTAVSVTETHQALMAVHCAHQARVRRAVYMSVSHADRAPYIPHFGSKIPVEAAIKSLKIPCTILRPNVFFQNDTMAKDALLRYGVYPLPIGDIGVSRVDVRDIAEAAAIALTTRGHEGQVYELAGPEVHTGQSTAEAWSRALGRKIAYIGNDLDAWETQASESLPPWMVFDFKLMFAFFQEKGLKATAEAVRRQTKLLGHAPRRFADFAAETARTWLR